MILKPFNLEAAKAGKPVCTRDGRLVRIVCWDSKQVGYPIIGLIKDEMCGELPARYTKQGESIPGISTDDDLFMAPEKKEGWINLYKDLPYLHTIVDFEVYDTEQEAKDNIDEKDQYITTIKIEWEE